MKKKILLAEDSLTIQKVVRITLSEEPYEIIECPSADNLLNKMKLHEIDLVCLDYNLSDAINGIELAGRIKSISPTTKVLMLYGTFDFVDDEALRSAKVDGKIIKPFESTAFVSAIHSLLEQNIDANDFEDNWSIKDVNIKTSEDVVHKTENAPDLFLGPEIDLPPVMGKENWYGAEEVGLPPVLTEGALGPRSFVKMNDGDDIGKDKFESILKNSKQEDSKIALSEEKLIFNEISINELKRIIEEVVLSVFESKIDKNLWKILPEIAERLINKEIIKIESELTKK